LKQPAGAFLIAPELWPLRRVMLILLALLAAAPAWGQGRAGVITLTDAELNFSTSWAVPQTGWEARTIPAPILTDELKRRENGEMTVWARMQFNRDDLPPGPIAFYTINTRERFILYLNGEPLYRNFAGRDDQMLGWNRPFLVQIPVTKLRPGENELVMRVDTGVYWHVGIGTVSLGPASALQAEYGHAWFWRIPAPMIATGIMMASVAYAFLLWMLGWRDKRALLWGFIGLFWLVRNLHFFVERPPFDAAIFREVSQYLIYFIVALTFSFCAEVFDLKRRRLFNWLQYSFAAFVCVLRYVLLQQQLSDLLCNILLLVSGLSVIYISARAWAKSRQFDHLLILLGLITTTVFSVHDIGRTSNVLAWDGAGFFLQPYAGFVMAWAFFVPIAANIVRAFQDVTQMNVVLEERVTEVTAALAASEAVRREQEVTLAIDQERERLMREIHDGIGSNLVTALAVAEQKNHPADSIATLRRSLSDLKLTVDSLEPVEGDAVALLANFRHRIDPDLREAGIACIWSVEPCPPLPWLDPVNALHLLRLIQEAISNVLAHAGATQIEILCGPVLVDEKDGILVEVRDNGRGFALDEKTASGRGLSSMRARAKSIGCQFALKSGGSGTQLSVWLPLIREDAAQN
jgi:signal transduction histidine kinase